MLFKDLIQLLKTVKTIDDLNPDIVEELTTAAVFSNMNSIERLSPNLNTKEAFNLARLQVLNQFDNLLLHFSEIDPED